MRREFTGFRKIIDNLTLLYEESTVLEKPFTLPDQLNSVVYQPSPRSRSSSKYPAASHCLVSRSSKEASGIGNCCNRKSDLITAITIPSLSR